MKKWSSAVLPLSILLVLVALTAWLRYASEFPELGRGGKNRHDPDLIISEARGHKLDAAGKLLYTLAAAEIRHFTDDNTTEWRQPKLVYLHPDGSPVTISAGFGRASAKGERVDLSQQVEIRRAATARNVELVAEMADLTVLAEEEKAFTHSRVLITQGQSWVQGVGMQVDHKLQTYHLESEVTGQIASHFGKKKPQP